MGKNKLSNLLSSTPLYAKLLISALLLAALILILITQLHHWHFGRSPAAPLSAHPAPPPHATPYNPNTTIQFDFSPYVRLYKNGRVERLSGTEIVSAGLDTATGVKSKDVIINSTTGLSARVYLPKLNTSKEEKFPILLYFHGGAFVIESPFSPTYHDYLNVLVSKARVVAVSVNYRRAPEYWLPVAYRDSFKAYKWTVRNSKSGSEKWLYKYGDLNRLFLAGDSAGGNIAHNIMTMYGAKAKGLALLNPYFWGKKPVGMETTDPKERRKLEVTWEFVCNNRYSIDHPLVNPMGSPSVWKRLSSQHVLMTLSELDEFKERGKAYVEGLKKSGWKGEAKMYETKGEGHVYFLYQLKSEKAVKEMAFVASFLNNSS
ncbi:alpha/beta-Hydrolases superfamily protein [Rhynchospora pubera]|uniref:Alpha/beta-Hydrolases superfamily protein n=1 Tax=Rhynchospora pubera TaxID=906938 RepID=A0AAV8GGR3_9POAL|nr:alpha/beta-Hydrolases superfamily protein [Rhynchospora pubera]